VQCTREAALTAAREKCRREGIVLEEPVDVVEHLRFYRIWSPSGVVGAARIIDVSVESGDVIKMEQGAR
jgi:hypothetical protein